MDGLLFGVQGRGQVLAAVLDPLDRPRQPAGQIRGDRLLGKQVRLLSEPAAHVGGHDADVVFGKVEHQRQMRTQDVRHLGGRPNRQRVGRRLERGHAAARLHGQRGMAPGGEPLGDDALRVLKRRGDLADFGVQGLHDVVAPLLMYERGTGFERLLGIVHDRERRVVHLDQRCGVFGRVSVVGHDRGDRLAHEADLIAGQHGPIARLVRRRLGGVVFHAQRLDGLRDLGARQDEVHVGAGRRGVRINRHNAGVRVRAAHEGDRRGVGQSEIVDVLRLTQQDARVLDAAHLGADHLSGAAALRHTRPFDAYADGPSAPLAPDRSATARTALTILA